ncbi:MULTISPECIES: DUF4143 domain-containing protein [unclassified Methanosarcina]|uniref:DUF4143 domain-containing protein n=1 Tax=unclassified Methanosarcina TaxID=2644672 RepID=UPI000AAEC45A|nr:MULTISPECIES: ATP-binding protein [unclassified Methanosarcina]
MQGLINKSTQAFMMNSNIGKLEHRKTRTSENSNIGKELSLNSLRKTLQVSNPTTIKEYLNYFENSYLMFTIPMYSESLNKQIYSNKKVYFIDTGLAQNISFRFSEDREKMLENLVFIPEREPK